MKPRFTFLVAILFVLSLALLSCGNSRSLQSVSVTPATAANSQAQFTATGTFNTSPTSVDITSTTTWCMGSSDGVCAGNIAMVVTVTAGSAHCMAGFSGTVTILAGQPGPAPGPDVGPQLKPFGAAQMTCL
jgi:hypothetical protein